MSLPPNGRTGLLLSIAELLHDGVEAVRRTSRAPARKSLPYAYYAKQYDLTRVSSEVETKATYGGVSYPRLLASSFEIRARGETWVEHFAIDLRDRRPAGRGARVHDVPAPVVAQAGNGARRATGVLTRRGVMIRRLRARAASGRREG